MTPEPQLDMLWESVDPAAALTSRFGFPDARGAAGWIAETLEEAWALHVESCDRLVISASKLLLWLTVDEKRVIAKCAVDPPLFAKLAEVDALTAWLDGEGIPVAAPIAATDGRIRVERGGSSLGLYPVVSGELLDVDDANQVETAGRMLATLHQALAAYPLPFAGERPGRVANLFMATSGLRISSTTARALQPSSTSMRRPTAVEPRSWRSLRSFWEPGTTTGGRQVRQLVRLTCWPTTKFRR